MTVRLQGDGDEALASAIPATVPAASTVTTADAVTETDASAVDPARPTLLQRIRFWSPVWASALGSVVLGVVWIQKLAGVGGDLSAQWAWAEFAARHPGSAYDLAWYGGMHPASYSLLTPYLMAAFGVRVFSVAVLAASSGLLGLLAIRSGLRWPLPVALWGAFGLWCNLAAGRVTFAIGLFFGLAALAAAGVARIVDQDAEDIEIPVADGRWGWRRVMPRRAHRESGTDGRAARDSAGWRRTTAVAVLALATTLSSPVAALFIEVVAAALLITGRRRIGLAMAVPPPIAVVATSLVFPFAGIYPIGVSAVIFTAASAALAALLAPKVWRTVRVSAWVYALGAVLTWLIPTPIGGNVERLGLLFGGAVILAALCSRPAPSPIRATALVVAFAACAYWTVTADIIGIPISTSTHQADALKAELHRLHAETARVEAVPMLNHWESWGLDTTAELARGWNRQADVTNNPLFYDDPTFTGAKYHDWLQRWAVGYVVLPKLAAGKLDRAARTEAAFIDTDPAWLQEIWHDDNWRLFRFTDAVPLADQPATVNQADAGEIVLDVAAAGPVLVRVPWSPWLGVDGPAGACLTQHGDWTQLKASAPGIYKINTHYRLPRGTPC